MIELKKEEVTAIVNALSALPYGQVSGIIQFFQKKLAVTDIVEKVEEEQKEG
jgi:hypothetical protein